MRRIASLALLASLGATFAGTAPTPPACEQAKLKNHWCKEGNVGYVASVEIRSRFLYDVLDAHGHDVNPAGMNCATCSKAYATHGFCPAHRMGYVSHHAFMSPLTYYLARGRTIDTRAITCPVCRSHTRGIGWCDADHVGIVGHVALDYRHEFDELRKAYDILLAANVMSATCERCAGAMVADGYCAIHRVRYKDGRAVSGTPPRSIEAPSSARTGSGRS